MSTIVYHSIMGEPPLDQPYYRVPPWKALIRFYKKYAVFRGRASRSEFWWSFFLTQIISIGILVLGALLDNLSIAIIVLTLFHIVSFVPFLAVTSRRIHDTNHCAKLVFIPVGISCISAYIALFTLAEEIITSEAMNTVTQRLYTLSYVLLICGIAYIISLCYALTLLVLESDPQGIRFDLQKIPRMSMSPTTSSAVIPVPAPKSIPETQQ